MTLEPLIGSSALYRADVSWNTSSELSLALSLSLSFSLSLSLSLSLSGIDRRDERRESQGHQQRPVGVEGAGLRV